jgi:integrase
MMPKTAKKCWSESFGVYGSMIRVAEREPGGVLYLLWVDNSGKQRKRSLGHRDRKLGKRQALELASRMAGEPVEEREPEVEPVAPSEPPVQEPVSAAEPTSGVEPLTLGRGIALAFDPLRGMYPTETKHTRESRKLAERGAAILGTDLRWLDLTPGKVQYLVRVLARQSKDGRGARSAEYTCDMLYTVASWLRQEGLIPDSAALPKKNWKTKLKQEWQALTGKRVEPQRLRHTVEEVAAIFGALPKGDPRVRLLVELAAELRAGQAVRGKRSDLLLRPVGGYRLGRFIVHGNGKKHGEVVDLHPELRNLIDDVLSDGYLCLAEAAYQRGEIDDYYLFPAGKLKLGMVPVERCDRKPLCSTAIRDMFREVEAIAGVEHVEGRSFYGLRRQATDLAPEFAQDARVLNRLTGHVDSATRERVYQDPQNELVRARAAQARRDMRGFLRGEGGRETASRNAA